MFRPWQQHFIETIKSFENCTINLFGCGGGEGKTFLALNNNDPDTEYVLYESFVPKRTTKRQVVISNVPLRRFITCDASSGLLLE